MADSESIKKVSEVATQTATAVMMASGDIGFTGQVCQLLNFQLEVTNILETRAYEIVMKKDSQL